MGWAIKHFVNGCFLFLVAFAAPPADENPPFPRFSEVEQTIKSFYALDRYHQPNDLISKSEAQTILKEIDALGWQVEDAQKILQAVLDDQHVLVATLRTPAGRRFMNKVSGRDLMYDRLDRISGVAGGPELIRDLVKLPDGEKYAKPRSGGGVPDLLDLLPKNASGKTRKIPDYHKPTGHLYTLGDLIERLKVSYREAESKAKANAAEPATNGPSAN